MIPHSKLIKRWHKLYVGGNGKITNGLIFENISSLYPPTSGYSHFYPMNDYTFRQYRESTDIKKELSRIGLSLQDYELLESELKILEESQK